MAPATYDDADKGNTDEYSSARKLVTRAAEREQVLSGKTGSGSSGYEADFSRMPLKPDHPARPCWTCPDGVIYLEAFHDLYNQAYDFLVAIAEPVARPDDIHEYKLTPYSLYAAVATNIATESIITVLERLSKNQLPQSVKRFIRDCTKQYGKAKLVLKCTRIDASCVRAVCWRSGLTHLFTLSDLQSISFMSKVKIRKCCVTYSVIP